jgi:hypothetical protein
MYVCMYACTEADGRRSMPALMISCMKGMNNALRFFRVSALCIHSPSGPMVILVAHNSVLLVSSTYLCKAEGQTKKEKEKRAV